MVMDIILGIMFIFLFLAMIGVASKLNEQESKIACLERKYLELMEYLLNERINRTTN